MIHTIDMAIDAAPPLATRWRGAQASNRLDCETGVLLRSMLIPVFDQATSWANLRRRLKAKGFEMQFHAGRLILTDRETGDRVCSCKYLGYPLAVLARRFGRLRAKAPRQGREIGVLLF